MQCLMQNTKQKLMKMGNYHNSTSTFLVILLLVGVLLFRTEGVWQENVRPKMYVQLGPDNVMRFTGNETHRDSFRLLLRDGNSLLVAARNLVYNLSLSDLTENQRLEWLASQTDVQMCLMKGKDEEDCQNYIRVLVDKGPGKLLICGTNAFKPICRDYSVQENGYKVEKEIPGQGLCPYDPKHNSTAVYVDGDLYTGTVADFSGMDPLIYREPLRTEQYDSKNLNAPNFVSSFTFGDFVYIFFRETAVEYINCGKTAYSRVARVCTYDRGGPHKSRNRWTSFLKSRLNCSISGDFPFYFSEIQSTTELVEGSYGGLKARVIYGVFTTPTNSISGSAVCAFKLQDITDTFEGPFKQQLRVDSNWLPVKKAKVPEPRPGQCVNNSRTLPDVTLNFIRSHCLMDEAVPAFFGEPLVVRTSFHYRFTVIAVDPQVKTPDGKAYDVLFIGTDNGKVIKAVNAESADTIKRVKTVIIEEIQVYHPSIAIRNLYVVRSNDRIDDAKLIVVVDAEVQAIKLQRCYSDKITTCSECVALQDPYCAWDKLNQKCRTVGSPRWSAGSGFIQSVSSGVHSSCPGSKVTGKTSGKDQGGFGGLSSSSAQHSSFNQDTSRRGKEVPEGEIINIIPEEKEEKDPKVSATDETSDLYSVETLAIAVTVGTLSALIVGFITGYCCGRKCHKEEEDNLPYPDTEYEYFEQRQNVSSQEDK